MTQDTKCPRCSHEWKYTGTAWWITCPHCRKIFKNPENQEKVENNG